MWIAPLFDMAFTGRRATPHRPAYTDIDNIF
jgi:hypothetical protein